MAKKRKTKKQKIVADTRRLTPLSPSQQPSYSLPVTQSVTYQPTVIPVKRQNISTLSYDYLPHDLRKTIILTASIIIAQLILLSITKLS